MLKCELHAHTFYSRDCRLKLEEIIKTCLNKKINCLAITDHNEVDGAIELKKIAPFKVIIGEEILTTEGEIIGYFLKEKINSNLNPEETIKQIKQQNGLVAIPHPFDRLRTSRMNFSTIKRIIDLIDILEIFNSRNVFSSDDKRAEEFCHQKNKVAMVGSDAHTAFELGNSYANLENADSPAEFINSLRKKRFVKIRSSILVHFVTKWNKLF